MKRIDIKINFQCNNHCIFCIQDNKREIYLNKSDEEVKSILRKMAKSHQKVLFTGGEPTLMKELIDWVKYAKKLGYGVQIQTNGRFFAYKDYCRALIQAGINEFVPSLHGSNAKIHDCLTRVPGSFKQTVRGIRNLKSLGQYVMTNSVINKLNYKDLPNLAKLLVNLKVHQFQFAFMHINLTIAHNQKLIKEIVPRYLEVEPYVKKGLQIGINAGVKVRTEAIPYCFMKNYEKYIAEKNIPDGAVYGATWSVKNYAKYRKTKDKAKGPNCPKCKYYKICEGPWKDYPQIFGWSEFKPIK